MLSGLVPVYEVVADAFCGIKYDRTRNFIAAVYKVVHDWFTENIGFMFREKCRVTLTTAWMPCRGQS